MTQDEISKHRAILRSAKGLVREVRRYVLRSPHPDEYEITVKVVQERPVNIDVNQSAANRNRLNKLVNRKEKENA